MFTGLVEGLGRIAAPGPGLVVDTGGIDCVPGMSLAVDGACLTVACLTQAGPRFDLAKETVLASLAGSYARGCIVNLERPLEANGRLHGHFVTGHVDCTAEVLRAGSETEIAIPEGRGRFLVEKGSVAVSGISLTIARLGPGSFTVALIPETLKRTTAGSWRPGTRVNLEFDILGKYVLRRLEEDERGARLKEYLEKRGDGAR